MQKKEDIQIVDIYWDRVYLHIKIAGDKLCEKEYAVAAEREKYVYRIFPETDEFVLNITNISEQQMLFGADWYMKYRKHGEVDDEWKNISVSFEVCRRMKELDKIYRYSDNNYAYVFSFRPVKKEDKIICVIQCAFMVRHVNPEKRVFRSEAQEFTKRWKKHLIYRLEKFHNVIYQIIVRLTPKNGKRILLLSETRDMGGNLRALDDRLKERRLDKEFKISYHFDKTLEYSRPKIFFIWLKLAVLTARQDFIFVDDYVPFFKYINIHHNTKLIQVWHAGVGFKTVGYARFGEEGSPHPFAASHRKYDYAIVGSEALRDIYAEVFGINREKCLPYGLMRLDGYMDINKITSFKEKFYLEYPRLKGKKIILFAPTFRGSGQRTAYYPYEVLEQDKLYDMCGEEYVFLIKMHPFVREKIEVPEKYRDRIIDFSGFSDINELFYVTDLLITDYSSNIYEFSLHKKPIIFFAYDKEEYELIRGVHRTLDEYAPGKICTTFDEVASVIQNKDFEMEKLYKFVRENHDKKEGYASDRVINHILLKSLSFF